MHIFNMYSKYTRTAFLAAIKRADVDEVEKQLRRNHGVALSAGHALCDSAAHRRVVETVTECLFNPRYAEPTRAKRETRRNVRIADAFIGIAVSYKRDDIVAKAFATDVEKSVSWLRHFESACAAGYTDVAEVIVSNHAPTRAEFWSCAVRNSMHSMLPIMAGELTAIQQYTMLQSLIERKHSDAVEIVAWFVANTDTALLEDYLEDAVTYGNIAVLDALIPYADKELIDELLIFACQANRFDVIRPLVDRGASANRAMYCLSEADNEFGLSYNETVQAATALMRAGCEQWQMYLEMVSGANSDTQCARAIVREVFRVLETKGETYKIRTELCDRLVSRLLTLGLPRSRLDNIPPRVIAKFDAARNAVRAACNSYMPGVLSYVVASYLP